MNGILKNLEIRSNQLKSTYFLAGVDDDQTKMLAYQTSRGAVSDYIQRYMTEYPNSSWEDLKSELNIRFAEVNDSHHAFTMLCKARQTKRLLRFMLRGCML